MKAIALARRHQAIAAYQQGASLQEVATTVQVSGRTIRRWVARWRATGSVAPHSSPGRPPRIAPTAADQITALVEAHPRDTR